MLLYYKRLVSLLCNGTERCWNKATHSKSRRKTLGEANIQPVGLMMNDDAIDKMTRFTYIFFTKYKWLKKQIDTFCIMVVNKCFYLFNKLTLNIIGKYPKDLSVVKVLSSICKVTRILNSALYVEYRSRHSVGSTICVFTPIASIGTVGEENAASSMVILTLWPEGISNSVGTRSATANWRPSSTAKLKESTCGAPRACRY